MTLLKAFAITAAIILVISSFKPVATIQSQGLIDKSDSLILEEYEYKIKKEFIEPSDSLTWEQLDSMFYEENQSIAASSVIYAPDSAFKVFTIEIEGCGAYCNSAWYSWIHFELFEEEKTKEININAIKDIYALPDNKYLIIDASWGRPASVLTVYCLSANVISFSSDSMTVHPITYRNQNHFAFCQENGMEMNIEPDIKYDPATELLAYSYANNYLYSHALDIDTLRQGRFKYIEGRFVLEKEVVSVNDNRNKRKKE